MGLGGRLLALALCFSISVLLFVVVSSFLVVVRGFVSMRDAVFFLLIGFVAAAGIGLALCVGVFTRE